MENKNLKIAFFGGSRFSKYYLETLKKSGIGEVFAFDKLPPKEEIEKISPDIGIIAYFGYIVPEEILRIPKKGVINVHYSVLPRWRGPAPVQYAILAGDIEIGVTILEASSKVDAGKILMQEIIPIMPSDTYLSLEEKLIPLGAKMMINALSAYIGDEIKLKAQDESLATYSKKIKKEDGKINWAKSADEIERMTRAYYPWPGAYTFIKNKILKIIKVEIIQNDKNFKIGEVFDAGGYPAIACGDGALRLLIIQPEGKKEMSGEAFLKGHRDFVGSNLTFQHS